MKLWSNLKTKRYRRDSTLLDNFKPSQVVVDEAFLRVFVLVWQSIIGVCATVLMMKLGLTMDKMNAQSATNDKCNYDNQLRY